MTFVQKRQIHCFVSNEKGFMGFLQNFIYHHLRSLYETIMLFKPPNHQPPKNSLWFSFGAFKKYVPKLRVGTNPLKIVSYVINFQKLIHLLQLSATIF